MKYLRLLTIATFVAGPVYAQDVYVGVFGGVAAYTGDLTNKLYPKHHIKGATGLSVNYELSSHLSIRSAITYCKIGGSDQYAEDPSRVRRNLSFETQLYELSAVGELNLLDMEQWNFTPYGFTGLALFHFNPYTFDGDGKKVFLKPLSTEGQGLSTYPDRKPYHLLQIAIPYGGGVKVKLNEQLKVGMEVGLRKLFTEYVDDVSTQYVDRDELLNYKGPLAVELSYRGDELDQGIGNSIIPYPAEGTLRGDPKRKDAYYFTGIHLSYFFNSNNERVRYGKFSGRRSKMGCPVNIY